MQACRIAVIVGLVLTTYVPTNIILTEWRGKIRKRVFPLAMLAPWEGHSKLFLRYLCFPQKLCCMHAHNFALLSNEMIIGTYVYIFARTP